MKKNFLSGIIAVILLAVLACNKVDNLAYYANGNAVTLTASKTTITSMPADSAAAVIGFSWSNPKYASDSNTYKYILEIDSTGRNFSKAITKTVTGTSSTTLTGKELNAILLNYGFAIGTAYTLDVHVISSYGNNNERYTSNIVKVQVTPYADAPVLASTATVVTGTLINAGVKALTFSWSKPFSGYNGNITYSLQYDSTGKNFGSLHETALGTTLYLRDMTQGEINQTALDEAVIGGTPGKIEYRIKAVTAAGATVYSNVVSVTINTYVPLFRFYMPGSYQTSTGNGTNWTPADAPEFVRDLRTGGQLNRLYYMYIYLPANTEFKITPARNFNVAYGAGANGALSTTGGNISVATAGNYRISIDVVNMKYDIRVGRMGFVGAATPAGWTPANTFGSPSYAMGYTSTNLFAGVTTFTAGGWKLIDNTAFDNGSSTLDETRSYGSTGASGSSLVVNGANMPDIATPGRYRVIWDGRDVNNVKYQMMSASIMKLVGDGINQTGVNDWDPPTSPVMTYSGNGIWTITIGLKANKDFKFLGGADWGAFDYEDASGGVTSLATARKVSFDVNGPNFKTPATAGTYTITLNENTQTVTVQ